MISCMCLMHGLFQPLHDTKVIRMVLVNLDVHAFKIFSLQEKLIILDCIYSNIN